MTTTLIRGRLLTFLRRPENLDDTDAFSYEADGGLMIRDGRIVRRGPFAQVRAQAGGDVEVVDHRPHLVLPGFIDAHAHFPQMHVIASFGTELLEWLNRYTFPEEMKFSDPAHCERIAVAFLDEMIRHGTTTAAVYCTMRPESADALFAEAEALMARY